MAEKTSLMTKAIGGFVVLMVGIALFNMAGQPERQAERQAQAVQTEAQRREALTPEARKAEDHATAQAERFATARGACLITLKKSLHDPDSAEIPSTQTWPAVDDTKGIVLVQPTLRAKNGFGAMRVGVWACKVQIVKGGAIVRKIVPM